MPTTMLLARSKYISIGSLATKLRCPRHVRYSPLATIQQTFRHGKKVPTTDIRQVDFDRPRTFPVCTENLNSDVLMMKSTQDGR